MLSCSAVVLFAEDWGVSERLAHGLRQRLNLDLSLQGFAMLC